MESELTIANVANVKAISEEDRSRHDFTVLEKRKIQVNFTCFIKNQNDIRTHNCLSLQTKKSLSIGFCIYHPWAQRRSKERKENGRQVERQPSGYKLKHMDLLGTTGRPLRMSEVPRAGEQFLLINSEGLLQWPPSPLGGIWPKSRACLPTSYKRKTVQLTSPFPKGF